MPFISQEKTNLKPQRTEAHNAYVLGLRGKYILILVILAVIVGGGILTYQYWWLPKEEVKIAEVKPPEEVTKDETADWKIYRNEEYGFEVKYPPDLKAEKTDSEIEFVKRYKAEELGFDPKVVNKEYFDIPEIIISINENPDKLSIEDFYDGDPGENYFGPQGLIRQAEPEVPFSESKQVRTSTITQREVVILDPAIRLGGKFLIFIVPFETHFFHMSSSYNGDNNIETLMLQSLKVREDF